MSIVKGFIVNYIDKNFFGQIMNECSLSKNCMEERENEANY